MFAKIVVFVFAFMFASPAFASERDEAEIVSPGGSISLTANFAVQGAPDPGIMVRGAWYPPAPNIVLVWGGGVDVFTLPGGNTVRPTAEFGLGIGVRYRINPKTKAVLDGSLAFGGGVGSFRTKCGPMEYDPNREYICGVHQDGGFPVVMTGPWIGAMAKLAVLRPVQVKGNHEVLVGGQFNLTVPLHLISNTWPRYQVEEGRTITVRTAEGEEVIRYRWERYLELITFPVFGGGVVIMW